MKKYLLLIFFVLLVGDAYSQTIISFDSVLTNTNASKSFYVKNPTNNILQITSIRTLTSKFYFNITPFNINPYDSVLVTIYFRANQNLTYKDFLIFENKGYRQSLVYYSLATAKYPDTIYRFTQGLIDEQLKTVLRAFTTTGYVSLGYNTARDKMFETVDDYNNTDTIECVYIGRKIHAATRTEAQNLGFDTEHTYPQSYFNQNEPMRSDLFHIYPTDNAPNNHRSNYPFGFVVSNITWDSAGSKLGKDSTGETVFEPRNVHKGNVARSIFYFCVKYIASIDTTFMSVKFENVLRRFNTIDTVDAHERQRNTSIYSFQHVRNPFIDHPEFFDRIISCYRVRPTVTKGKISASPFNVTFDTLNANDTSSYYLSVLNYGNGTLTISSAVSNLSQFIVESTPSSVPAGEMRFIKIKFNPTAQNQTYIGTLTIQNSDSTIIVNLKGFSRSSIGVKNISNEIPSKFKLFQNYPNPFNPVTKIKFSVPDYDSPLWRGAGGRIIILKVYNLIGKELSMLVNENLQPGIYEVTFDASNLPSGIYYYKLTTGDFIYVKKMLMIK